MEREEEWMQPSIGDSRARDKERPDHLLAMGVKEVRTVRRDFGDPGAASDLDQRLRQSAEDVDELERNSEMEQEGSVSMQSPSCSSSSSSCPSPSALLSTLSLSSSSLQPSLVPPLALSLKLDTVLVDGRLVLDVYQRGGAVMPALWESAPERMKRVQYVRLGSEDEETLEDALGVLPHLTQLRSLAIRGIHTHTHTCSQFDCSV